jgi:uncharacterized protein
MKASARALLFAAFGLSWGADFAALKPQGYVSDFARVVDPATRQALENYCAAVEKATGAQMALVTINTLDNEPITDVANLLYRKWGVGQKGKDEGVMVLLAIRDRRSRVEVGYGLEPVIPDGFAGSVLRDMRPALREGDYGLALTEAARVIGQKVAAAKGVAIPAAVPSTRPRAQPDSFPWGGALAIGALLLFLLLAGGGRGRTGGSWGGGGGGLLAGMILGNLLGGGGPRVRSSGGFGGYDSGDGFGGFGGGDSGGGGASSDW